MAKLYLIRRNLETFSGPMTLSEMKEAYKRMQFGLQDEVSGHCGPWVAFDALEKIKKHYPEVARIVNEDMLAGWGVSQHGERIVADETKRIEIKSTRGIGLALAFLAIALAAFAAAIYMANSSRLSGKARESSSNNLKLDDPKSLIDRGDQLGFDQYMLAHADEMVDRIERPLRPEQQWLPYLRAYAFAHDGQINGLDPKWLRGASASSAPVDCSLKMWKSRWLGSVKSWNDFVVQRRLVHAHWARLLAWDPYWIRRRDNKGWIGGGSYYLGCMTMAEKALADVAADPTVVGSAADWGKLGLNKIRQRLEGMLDIVKNGQPTQPEPSAVDGNLALWSCFEGARDVPALQKCHDGVGTEVQDVWGAYTEERYGWNLLRLASTIKGSLPPDLAQALTAQAAKMNKEDQFTRFDYRAEAKLMRTLLKTQGPVQVEKIVEKTQADFPDVKLAH